jgi:carbon-monoxide dehydrogenase small subunit
MTTVSLTVNGRPVTEDVPPRLHLADFLRERLLLTGTHIGCEHGVCGACTIIMDGEPGRSCIAYAAACNGMTVQTIEGLEHDPVAIRLRAAFTAHHALQCGYCTPGMLVTARDIVTRLPGCTDDTIRLELAGNLCRCTGYNNIVRAIRQVLDEHLVIERPAPTRAQPLLPLPAGGGWGEGEPNAPVAPARAPGPGTAPAGGLHQRLHFTFSTDALWAALRDPAVIVSCIPGAVLLSSEGDQVTGEMIVALGPVKARFRGTATLHYDDATHTGAVTGTGQDQASGTRLSAKAPFRVEPDGAGSILAVDVDFTLQGPLAQLAKGRILDLVAGEIAALFAQNLTAKLAGKPVKPLGSLSALALAHRMLLAWIRSLRG